MADIVLTGLRKLYGHVEVIPPLDLQIGSGEFVVLLGPSGTGGQRQRVAMGRAIVRQPRVFLFDEPLSNLDAKLRARTRFELCELHDKLGATSIFVTHDQVEAMTMADRIVLLDQGRIQQIGSPREIYENPCNRFVASFIRSPEINLLDGRLQVENGAVRFGRLGLPISERRAMRVHALPSSKCTLGIRPERFDVSREPLTGTVPFAVSAIEYTGADVFAIGATDYGRLTVELSSDDKGESREGVATGTVLHVRPATDGWHIFDASGMCLTRG